MSRYIVGIDPGNIETGVCIVDKKDYSIIYHAKLKNDDVIPAIMCFLPDDSKNNVQVVIEMIKSYGMSVGQTVFDTCVWIGRFQQMFIEHNIPVEFVCRLDEKLAICHSPKANDTTIKQALVDRFAYGVENHGKGTKKDPGYFYGFKQDEWSAFAICVTYIDMISHTVND